MRDQVAVVGVGCTKFGDLFETSYEELICEAAFEAYAGTLGGPAHPLLGTPTLAVTLVHGGHKENVIPDRCEFTIDRRLIPGETETEALANIREAIVGCLLTLNDRARRQARKCKKSRVV